MTTLIFEDSSYGKPEDIIAMIRRRSGGNLSATEDVLVELPDALERLVLKKGCGVETITFLKLRAMLGEGRVEWEVA